MDEMKTYKKAVDSVHAPLEVVEKTISELDSVKKKGTKGISVLIIQLAVAACACLALGFGVDNLRSADAKIEKHWKVGSVFGEASPYILPVIIFIMLAVFFVFLFRKKNKNK